MTANNREVPYGNISEEERAEITMATHCVGRVEAARIMRLEDQNRKPELRPEDCPTFNEPFEPIILLPVVSDHWKRELAEFRKKGPRWASPLYAKALSEDTGRHPEFNQKAALVLNESGMSGPAISKVLGISLRSVRFHLSRPCEALEAERREIVRRKRRQHHMETKRGGAPFLPEAYLVSQKIVTDPKLIARLGSEPFRQLQTRQKVQRYMADGFLSHRQMAKLLGITRQAVGLHVKNLREIGLKAEL